MCAIYIGIFTNVTSSVSQWKDGLDVRFWLIKGDFINKGDIQRITPVIISLLDKQLKT